MHAAEMIETPAKRDKLNCDNAAETINKSIFT